MKSFLFFSFIFCMSLQSITAQYVDRTNFRAGVNGGLVLGDFSEAYSFTLGADLYYHWGISKAIDLGLATGFTNAFGEKETLSAGGLVTETTFDNVQFVPVGGSVRLFLAKGFKIGGDVGYALGVNEGNEGGFYYRPVIGVEMNQGSSEFNVSYSAVNGDVPFSTVLAGFLILF